MNTTQAHHRRPERGSALLLSLLLTVTGAALIGLTVDATYLLWVRAHAQTAANLAAAAVALELERNPAAPQPFLLETARAAAALNGYRHGARSASVQLDHSSSTPAVIVARDAEIFFLRMVRPQPVAVRARAIPVQPSQQVAGP